jgi:hypothetical protein
MKHMEEHVKLNILFLCNKPSVGRDANTIVDHIEAFERYSEHTIWLCSNLGDLPNLLELEKFDVIIIHYSLFILSKTYLSNSAKKRLRAYTGMKVIFIQDEYRRINDMVSELAFLKIDVLFTCFPSHEFEKIYPPNKLPRLSKYNNLTGYVPERLIEYKHQPPICQRPLDVVYRGRKLSYWYGALGYEKWNIVEKWHEHVPKNTLKADISCRETDRIYGSKWIEFLTSSKTTLGVESGASVMDFTGELEKQVEHHQLIHPMDSFHTVQKKYFLEQEGQYQLNQISPRCFEAIALKTVLVLYEGEYSNVLVPNRHYIALKKDFSNIENVLALIQDDVYLQNMADTAYQEIALNPKYSYQAFIEYVDKILQKEFVERAKIPALITYEVDLFDRHVQSISLKKKAFKKVLMIYQGLPFGVRIAVKSAVRPTMLFKNCAKSFFLFSSQVLRKKK